MVVNLIKSQQMFSVTLPNKIQGQYWLTDIDKSGKPRNLVRIEAVNGQWYAKSNSLVMIKGSNNQVLDEVCLNSMSFFNVSLVGSNERIVLFAESLDASRQNFTKIVIREAMTLDIGRNPDNNLCIRNQFISGKHARLSYDGRNWSVIDMGSTNGTFVNGYRVDSQNLDAGDLLYIMGLKIVVGYNFIAVNNPDGQLSINARNLAEYLPQKAELSFDSDFELPPKQYFFRSPRFHREVEHVKIKIDPPPQRQKEETVPLAFMLGPSLTMGMASMGTGIFTVMNALESGGDLSRIFPTLMMSVSMLAGTVLWPILTKRHEKKVKAINESKRQNKYLAYLDEIRDTIRRKSKEQSDILNSNIISIEECAQRIAQAKPNLWERVIGQKDFMRLRLGVGTLPLDAEVSYSEKKFSMDDDNLQDAMFSLGSEPKQLVNVPISISLTDTNYVGIFGHYGQSINLVKSFILQMMALHSYNELKIMLITDENSSSEWDFIKWIPHFWDDNKETRFFATNNDEVKELSSYIEKNILSRPDNKNGEYSDNTPYYVVISTNIKLQKKCEAIQQLLNYENNCGFSVVILAEELKDLPKETKIVVKVNGAESEVFDKDDTSGEKLAFSLEMFNEAMLNGLSEDIANIELDLSSQRYDLPSMLTFLEMFNVSKMEHLNILSRWKENNPTISLQAPIGVDTQGDSFYLDLHEKYHGPHGLVAGMTGSGKSEFIITYILSLAVNYHPDEVAFILIDYKGGGLTGAFEDSDRGIKLPHLAGTITNLDGAAIQRSLISIQSELRRRQAIFNEARKISNEGTMDIYKYQQLYRDKIVSEPVPHLFIISDEFAELKTQQPEFMEQLISTARIGRSLGVHLILATQKPSGVVDDQIWSNSKFRVCLKVQDKADSQDMIKRPDAAELSQTGRFYLQVGFNEFFALGQSAWCGAEYIPTDEVEKTVDNSIQVVDHLGRVLMNVKPEKKKVLSGSKVKQIVAIVKYLSDIAHEESISVKPLWLDPISDRIFVEDLERKYSTNDIKTYLNPVVGEYDDPFNQRQGVLTVPFSDEGNCLVYGAIGNGKTTFVTTLCYSLLKNHTAEELNLYIADFGSETMKCFEKAPQVGGVITASDEEKTINLFKMLFKELDRRRGLFSEFGGDYTSYCKNSGKIVPNIVVVINNFAGFTEQYENLYESFNLLSRDGVKFGIYFVITANSTGAVRYRTAQNFKTVLTMQLNDISEYPITVGRTEGLIPSKFKGRGLVNLGKVYEFQTAYCKDVYDTSDFIRSFCKELYQSTSSFARKIPVLPETVTLSHVREAFSGMSSVPVGIAKKSLDVATINIANKLIYPVASQDIFICSSFAKGLVKSLAEVKTTCVFDAEMLINGDAGKAEVLYDDADSFVDSLYAEMVERNNTYKKAKMDLKSLEDFDEKVYAIIGMKKLFEQVSAENKTRLATLLEKGEAIYKVHFVIFDAISMFATYSYEAWYKKHVSGGDALWIGDGIADQYTFKLNKLTSDLYEDVGEEYGYVLLRNKPTLVKLLTAHEEEE